MARSAPPSCQADIRNPLRYAALHQITAPQFIRRSLHSSWYKQVPTHCLLLFAIEAGDLLDLVKRAKYFSMFISYIVSYQIDISLYHKKRQSRLLNFKSRSVLFLCLCAPPVSVFSEIINTHKNTHNLTCCNGHPYSIHAQNPRQNQYRHDHKDNRSLSPRPRL